MDILLLTQEPPLRDDEVVSGNAVRTRQLRKGLVGVVNAFATRHMAGSNAVIIAHEMLHTLGATDKYDLATNQPLFPHGYADPDRDPLYPQRRAEIMGGRVPLSAARAEIPSSLKQVVVGPATALELRWR